MKDPNFDVAFSIGQFNIYWYAILLAVGIAFFIVYAIGKKTWAKELAELDAEKRSEE